MSKKSLQRIIVSGEDLENKIEAGVRKIGQVALASYGVNAGNVMVNMRFGEPLVSHDGITNIGKLVLPDDTENAAVSIIRQAAEKTNRIAGDATTLTTILTCELYRYYKGEQSSYYYGEAKGGYSSTKLLMDAMNADCARIIDRLEGMIQKADDYTLKHIAKTSTGDDAMAALVYESIMGAGDYGSVVIVESAEPVIRNEVISGATFTKGIKTPALVNDPNTLKTNYNKCAVVVLDGLYTKSGEILPILEQVVMANRREKLPIVIIGDVSGQALETVISNHRNGVIDVAIVEPELENRDTFLDDIATYCGAKVYVPGGAKFDESYIGSAESAAITLTTTTIEAGDASREACASRVAAIKTQLANALDNKERVALERRLAILDGKSVKIYVGANTQAERQESKLRIEDAVCAVKAAKDSGTLPGGGVALRMVAHETDLPVLARPFCFLNNYDDEPSEVDVPYNIGFDIVNGNMGEMRSMGIVDSALAIEEAVSNAYSAAQSLLTVKVALEFAEAEA